MHHYPFHPGDYMLSTAHLTLEEDATYRRALDHYYDTEAPLALDKRTLSKRQANAKLTTNQEPLTKNQVQTPLPPQTPPAPPSSGGEVSLLEADGVGEGKANPDIPSTTQSKRIAMVFRRRLTTAWTKNEIAAYKKLGTIPEDDLAAVERYYSELWPPDREKNILRHDLVTFLRNFQGEVDRAHSYGRKAAKEPVKRESEFSANTIKRL